VSLGQALLLASSGTKLLTFQDISLDTVNRTVYTFSACAIGAEDGSRRVIVFVAGRAGGGTITGATIGGVTADIVVQVTNNAGGGNIAVSGIIIAAVPTGTTADVVVTFSTGQATGGIGWWTARGMSSNTPIDSGTSVADPSTDTLATTYNGFCIAGMSDNVGSASATWTNVDEKFDTLMEATSGLMTGGSIRTTGSNISPTCTPSSSVDPAGVFATF